jgi:UDP-N-acetylmuramate--alanine ligase
VGELRRFDASLAAHVILAALPETDQTQLIAALNNFPGTGRRFERITDGVYTDYGHHPIEIKATLKMARELKERDNYKGVVAIYQPHQNVRQHEIKDLYKDAFEAADKIFWLPTYLTRENPELEVLTPEQLFANLNNAECAEAAKADDALAQKLQELHKDGWLLILMTAGPADSWYRKIFKA